MNVILRDIQAVDLPVVREWRNSPNVSRYMFTEHVISAEEHLKWFERIKTDPSCKVWIIQCDKVGVGLANIYNLDRRNSRCYWGSYVADDKLRGKGIGSFVEYLVLRHVFDELRLHKLCCEVLSFNTGAIDIHRSFGFKEEGRLRQHLKKGGLHHDVVLLGILRKEWEIQHPIQTERMRARGML